MLFRSVHGRVVTAKRRAAARYRQAQRAADSRLATTALRLAVHDDPAFGLAVADLDAITGTASQGPSRQQMNWERHHIEVVRAAATGNARRAADLLREHLASVGCDPLAVRITARLQPPMGPGKRAIMILPSGLIVVSAANEPSLTGSAGSVSAL